MRINRQRLVAVALLVLLPAAVAFPWGSISPLAETHQYVVARALDRLENDPAFEANLWFPHPDAIKSNEGIGMNLEGPGADGNGNSDYSQHYYNPWTKEGGAPDAVAEHFRVLIGFNVQESGEDPAGPKAAAYSAHFLADICDPYHVNGASIKTASKIWVDQRAYETQQVDLSDDITGLPVLDYSPTDITGLRDRTDFYTVLSRFIILTDYDWFDPWYYNGDPDDDSVMTKLSSHILWEARPTGTVSMSTFHKSAGQGLDGYDPHWHNAAPTFDKPLDGQAKQARQFAIFQATQTRTQQKEYFDDATLALGNTIRAVYTLWRASFSGLRPVIEYQPEGATTAYRVTGKVTNAASAAASSLRARLTATGCTVVPDKDLDKDKAKSLGALATGKTGQVSASWQVQPETGKWCNLRLEVVGAYSIPDLQYANEKRSFFPKQVAQSVSKPEPSKPSKPTTTTVPPATAHFERGDPEIVWRPAFPKPGSLGLQPQSGDHWGEKGEVYRLDSVGSNHLSYSENRPGWTKTKRIDVSWTEPPRMLNPNDELVLELTYSEDKGSSSAAGFGSARIGLGQRSFLKNPFLVNAFGPGKATARLKLAELPWPKEAFFLETDAPTIPVIITYRYRWVGPQNK
jgi:hypothetical protein